MKPDQIVALVSRGTSEKEYLLVRPAGETLLQFPIIGSDVKIPDKTIIKHTLKVALGFEVTRSRRIAAAGYQGPGIPYYALLIYDVETDGELQPFEYYEAYVWMSYSELLKRTSQLSNIMQEAIIPELIHSHIL